VANVETKTIEVVGPRSALTPCILDDDPEQLSLLSKMISEMGYESLLTDDPEEAVRLVQSGTCRVILADVHLPGIHAYEFLDRLLRVDPGVHVIIITKEYTLESALEAIRRGATDFLPKPLDRLHLKLALDDVASLYDPGGTVPGRSVLSPELDSNPRALVDGASRGYSATGAILCKKLQPGL
jgi:CheY-like chemotaxis protein